MQVWQIVLLTLIAFLKKIDHKGPQIAIYNSMFWGSLAGLIMGDFETGLYIGGMFQLMSLGVTAIGGASVPDYQIAAIVSTAVAVSTGQGAEAGIVIGLPVAMICIQLDVMMNLADGFLVRKSQAYCSRGEFKKMLAMLWLCVVVTGLSTAVPTFAAVAFGPAVVEKLYGLLPSWFLPGLAVAGKLLPVCGIAALLRYMPVKKHFEYLLFGFVLSAYLKVPILGVALLGIGFSHMLYQSKKKEAGQELNHQLQDISYEESESPATKLSLRMLRYVGWRYCWSLESFNYENQMAGGVVYALAPALRKIYQKDEEYKEALHNHFKYFNMTPWLVNLMLGAVLAIEERKGIAAKDTVQNIKIGLMGALSSFGDTIFFLLIPTIFGSVGGYMAMEKNAFGMAVWLLYGLILFFVRPFLVEAGYKSGYNMLQRFGDSLWVFTEAASALGLAVVGSMISTVVKVQTPLTFVSGEVVRELQPLLDSILPSMIAVIAIGLVIMLLKIKVKLSWVVFLIIAVSCFCSAFGILA